MENLVIKFDISQRSIGLYKLEIVAEYLETWTRITEGTSYKQMESRVLVSFGKTFLSAKDAQKFAESKAVKAIFKTVSNNALNLF